MKKITYSYLTDVHIMVGLPGSGKTRFSRQRQHNGYKIDCDSCQRANSKDKIALIEYINNMLYQESYNNIKTIFIDGLFLSTEVVISILNLFNSCSQKIQFHIHIWNIDRESCLWNDKYRREIDSSITIKHAKIDIDIPKIETLFKNIEVVEHKVERISAYIIFARKFFNTNDIFITSSSGRNLSLEFDKFDEVIEIICPNINIMLYKKLFRTCVETTLSEDCDYYGNSNGYSINYYCDIEKMYNFLIEHKLFSEKNL